MSRIFGQNQVITQNSKTKGNNQESYLMEVLLSHSNVLKDLKDTIKNATYNSIQFHHSSVELQQSYIHISAVGKEYCFALKQYYNVLYISVLQLYIMAECNQKMPTPDYQTTYQHGQSLREQQLLQRVGSIERCLAKEPAVSVIEGHEIKKHHAIFAVLLLALLLGTFFMFTTYQGRQLVLLLNEVRKINESTQFLLRDML